MALVADVKGTVQNSDLVQFQFEEDLINQGQILGHIAYKVNILGVDQVRTANHIVSALLRSAIIAELPAIKASVAADITT